MKTIWKIVMRLSMMGGYIVSVYALIRGSYSERFPERMMILAVGMLVMIVLGELWDVTGRKHR